jgi:hypothetical protein
MTEQRFRRESEFEAGESRFRPEDGCPLFSERLEEHLVAVSRGETPNRGRFCGNCYTPMSPDTAQCSHCAAPAAGDLPPVERVPDAVMTALIQQRKTESAIVNGFAYLGLLISVLGGLAIVLGIPALRENLIAAFIVYALILLIGGRGLAGLLGGYYGDRLGYRRARRGTVAAWEQIVASREAGRG